MLSIFSCVCWPSLCLCFLWRNIYLSVPLGFYWVVWVSFILSRMSCLYILEINPLSVASFANISSHSESCLLVLFYLWFPLLCQKLLNLIRSYLFIFVFIFTTLGSGSKKILLQFMSKNVFHVFL